MNVIRTCSPVDRIRRAVRAAYWRWRSRQADTDADYCRAAAQRNELEADDWDLAARAMREKAWRIERGVE